MIDPLVSLAFAMETNLGAYALLVGSGVSRSAQIPTGWEIVLDLIGRIAKLEGEECDPDRAAWYRNKYGEEPDYAKMIQMLAKSPEERHQFLRGYFEPNEAEREQGVKLPTAAHRAIADLVVNGHVRVVITTNFNQLLERTIEEAGVTPTVLSTIDAIEGALPLVHQRCVVVKVHGDYLDTRIKNTPEELAIYDERLAHLLDRILDEFGFVVCGWSADWDPPAAAFDRCKSRRFSLYWASRGEIGDNARRLLQARSGTIVRISNADAFFTQLSEKTSALKDMQQSDPLTVATALVTVNRLISEPRYRVRLYELLRDETEAAFSRVLEIRKQLVGEKGQADAIAKAFGRYFEAVSVLRDLMIHGCYWAARALRRLHEMYPTLGTQSQAGDAQTRWFRSPSSPAAILFYAAGIAALAGRNYGMFAHLMRNSTCRDEREDPFVLVFPWNSLHRWAQPIPETNHRYAADSRWLFQRLREPLRPLAVGDDEYEAAFDRFEYLRSLVHTDLKARKLPR